MSLKFELENLEWKLENGYYDSFGDTGSQNPDFTESRVEGNPMKRAFDFPSDWEWCLVEEVGHRVVEEC